MKYLYRLLLIFLVTTMFAEDVVKYSKLPAIGNDELTIFWDGKTSIKPEVPVQLSDLYKDGPLLMSFWFLGCAPCVAEMKHLSKFNEKYKDTGFKIISINTDKQSKGRIKSFVKKKKYSFNMLFDRKGKDGVIKKLGSNSCPFTALINMDGTIYSKHLGYERGDEVALEKEINELIEYNKQFKIEVIDSLKIEAIDSLKIEVIDSLKVEVIDSLKVEEIEKNLEVK